MENNAFLFINKKSFTYVKKSEVDAVWPEFCNREDFESNEREYGFYLVFHMKSNDTFASQSIYAGAGNSRERARELAEDCTKHVVKQLIDDSSDKMYGLD